MKYLNFSLYMRVFVIKLNLRYKAGPRSAASSGEPRNFKPMTKTRLLKPRDLVSSIRDLNHWFKAKDS